MHMPIDVFASMLPVPSIFSSMLYLFFVVQVCGIEGEARVVGIEVWIERRKYDMK